MQKTFVSAMTTDTDDFKRQVLGDICRKYGLKSGYWIRGSVRYGVHGVTSHNMPEPFFQFLGEEWHKSPLSLGLLSGEGQIIWPDDLEYNDISRDLFLGRAVKLATAYPAVLCARLAGPGDLYSVIGFFKETPDQQMLSTAQRAELEIQIDAALAAASAGLVSTLNLAAKTPEEDQCQAAVVDQFGFLHAFTEDFLEEIKVLGWSSRAHLVKAVKTSQSIDQLHAGRYIRIRKFSDYLHMVLVKQAGSDATQVLSEREINVLTLFVQGSTRKEMGLKLDLAPSTISSHLQRVRSKLGVSSREDLRAKMPKAPFPPEQ
ncbi:MAG: response regulator transcription factor [Alphaproteobacteria bacterium]